LIGLRELYICTQTDRHGICTHLRSDTSVVRRVDEETLVDAGLWVLVRPSGAKPSTYHQRCRRQQELRTKQMPVLLLLPSCLSDYPSAQFLSVRLSLLPSHPSHTPSLACLSIFPRHPPIHPAHASAYVSIRPCALHESVCPNAGLFLDRSSAGELVGLPLNAHHLARHLMMRCAVAVATSCSPRRASGPESPSPPAAVVHRRLWNQ
jgi:hypothetical protein